MSLVSCSATELAKLIRAKSVSAVEVAEAHLQRIEAVNPSIDAIVQLSPSVVTDARRADDDLRHNRVRGPLHGVPFTVKDWIETEGIVCAAGIEARRDYVPKRDATVVARLRAAGAILLGKSKPGSTADVYPEPHNPYRVAHTPGGSSSGEAAIIAARGSPLGLGSDSGGSIRWPAHCCGIAGLKPTSGYVPNTGHVPIITGLVDPRTTIGPMARCVDDLVIAWQTIAGIDGCDAAAIPMPLGDASSVAVAGLRIAYFTAMERASPTREVCSAVAAAVEALSAGGATVTQACPPRIDESLSITRAYWSRPASVSPNDWRPHGKSSLSADDVERSLFEWDRLRRAFLGFMNDFDLIVCPVASETAPARNDMRHEDFVYMLPFSLTGYPVVALPVASADGLPIGVQLVARPWHDHVALACARMVEDSVGHLAAPPL